MQRDTELPHRRARRFQIAIVTSVVAVILVLWAVVAISTIFDRQAAFDRARSNAANLSAAFSEELTHSFDSVNATMDILAARIKAEGFAFDIRGWATQIPLMASGTVQAAIIGSDGKLVSSTIDPGAAPIDLSDREHIRVHLDGKVPGLFVGKPVLGRVSHQVTLQLTRRVDAQDGRLLGIILLSLPPGHLTGLAKSIDLGPLGVIVLTGLDNVILARFTAQSPDGLQGIGRSIAGGTRPASFPEGAEGYYVRDGAVDGVRRILHYRRIDPYRLVVTVGLDLDQALAASTTQTWILVSLAGVATLILAILAGCLVREIGKRAAGEIEIANQQTLLQDAVESVSEGFVIYDRDDRLLVLNEPYKALFGEPRKPNVTFEELVRQGLAEGRYLEAVGRENEWLSERLRRHRECAASIEQRMSDGRWVLAADRRMRNGGIVGLRIDITGLKQAQAALGESEARLIRNQQHLALAQELSGTGSLLRDFGTDTVEWSDELYRIFGLERGAVVPCLQTLMERIHPDDRADMIADRASAMQGAPLKIPEYRIVRPDGAVRVVQRGMRLFHGEGGKLTHFLVVFRDITEARETETERRALERQLYHSQKLEALGTLAGGIAHDLNNTLVPIITISKLSLRHATPGTPQHEDLERIYRSGLRARDLVRQVVTFTRKEVADRCLFRVDEVVNEALSMLRSTIPAMIRLKAAVTPVPPVLGDSTQIHQVVVNLVTNAVHAIGMGHGTISISLEEIASRKDGEPSLVRLTVADTGCGMDEETQRRIFDPFFTTKAVGEGTGLGLSVVHGIVSNHHGSIAVESALGRGTRFIVDLPIATHETEAADQRSVA
jgi:PAS domain S-box-containing protein